MTMTAEDYQRMQHEYRKQRFMDSYVATFLAGVAVQKYMTSRPYTAADAPPTEDAIFCAEEAWAALPHEHKALTG